MSLPHYSPACREYHDLVVDFGRPDGHRGLSRPLIIVLCGSTRFKREFEAATRDFSLAGHIVLSVGLFAHADLGGDAETVLGEGEKARLDYLHLRKIDLADSVYVVDGEVDGRPYIGQSTAREIAYAERLGKPIRYLSREPAGATS